jgi:regulator of sirC expression with transglutaminase-like and TPR domain
VRAAVAVAMHELGDAADPDAVVRRLDELAERVRGRVQSERPDAFLAHLHAVLFDEEDFRGNAEDYTDPRNSYLPWVLEQRRGLPITLTLVYREVARRVGLRVEGINAPGHFLARVRAGEDSMIVDPFFRGRVVSTEEACEFLQDLTGSHGGTVGQLLPRATRRQWLTRILLNLESHLAQRGRPTDAAAMRELRGLLG